MGVDFHWDREMTSEEIFGLSPEEKKLRTALSMSRKVDYLEQAARSSKAARALDLRSFRSRNAFRKWNDVALKLWRWSDSEIDRWSEGNAGNPDGPNESFMRRWAHAVATITALQNTSVEGLERTIEEQALIIASLESQILALMEQLDRANRRVR